MIPRLSFFSLLVVLAACAHATPTGPAAPAAHLGLDGAVIRSAPDPLTGLTTYDPPLLLHLADEARRAPDAERAVALYQRLLAEFPESGLALAATFGLGLASEDRHDLDLAARAYEEATRRDPGTDEAARRIVIDAHFRLAGVLAARGESWRVVAVFDQVLGRNDLAAFDRLQAIVGRGVALRRAGDDAGAETAFVRALTLAEDARGRGESDGGLAAEAALESMPIS
jgi:tetratricopeptide (TPR) repeat protein